MKLFDDINYRFLVFLVVLSFCVTMASDLLLCCGIRTILVSLVFVYVSCLGIKDPKCYSKYPIAYLQYFWATAVAFCLVDLLKAMEVQFPTVFLLGIFALFPIISLGVIWRKREYKVVSPYAFVQIAFFVAVLLDHVINA